MDPYNFHNARVEKADVVSRHHRIQKLTTTVFRLVELLVFLIMVSKFSTQFAFSFRDSREYIRGISVTLISPRFVFLVGNTIIIVLVLKSRRISSRDGEKGTDFYEKYTKKCRENHQTRGKEERKAPFHEQRKINKSYSEQNMQKMEWDEQCCKLRRSMTERRLKREDDMSGEEFRVTVEAFIARQQRSLREEEGLLAVVSTINRSL